MNLPVLNEHPECQLCNLYLASKNPGLSTTRLDRTVEGASKAVLIIGEKPGVVEDKTKENFTGESGKIARGVYMAWIQAKVKEPVHFYGQNSVRCLVPGEGKPNVRPINMCRGWLMDDLVELRRCYSEVVVLCAGTYGCRTMGLGDLTRGLRNQGTLRDGVRLFSTNNPAALLPHRDPSLVESVEDHLSYLIEYLNTGKITYDIKEEVLDKRTEGIPDWSLLPNKLVALDTETYGICEPYPKQRTYNPMRSLMVDRCPWNKLLVSAAASWYSIDGEIDSMFWNLQTQDGRKHFRFFLDSVVRGGRTILGMNLPYDMSMLRAGGYLSILNKDYMDSCGCLLADVAVANQLESDVRQERSLKDIAKILRITCYDDELSLKDGDRYLNNWDPALERYNVKDTVATLESWTRLCRMTKEKYPNTTRFSPRCVKWFSDCLWSVTELNEAGVKFNREKTEKEYRMLMTLKERVLARGKKRGYILAGKGSKPSTAKLVVEAVAAAELGEDPRLELTGVTKVVSTGKENRNLILDCLSLTHPIRSVVRLYDAYKRYDKLTGSYLGPLLNDPITGLVGDMAWPSWFTVRGNINDDSKMHGGSKQGGRITCKNPALQTMPKKEKKLLDTRYDPGFLAEYDLSQIELRIIALTSGDPVMMDEYVQNKDRHQETGYVLLRVLDKMMRLREVTTLYGVTRTQLDEWLSNTNSNIGKWRHLGKTINFAMGYLGGAKTVQESARRLNRIELDIEFCKALVRDTGDKYHVLRAHQKALIDKTVMYGYQELPITGESRIYLGGKDAVKRTYSSVICNQGVQSFAANIMKDVQRTASDALRVGNFKTRIVMNGFDSLYLDGPSYEEGGVHGIMDAAIMDNGYYKELCLLFRRTVPISYERKVLARKGAQAWEQPK